MSATHLDAYAPSGYDHGFPYWDTSVEQALDRDNYRNGWYLRGLVRVHDFATWFGTRYMRADDAADLERCLPDRNTEDDMRMLDSLEALPARYYRGPLKRGHGEKVTR